MNKQTNKLFANLFSKKNLNYQSTKKKQNISNTQNLHEKYAQEKRFRRSKLVIGGVNKQRVNNSPHCFTINRKTPETKKGI